MALVAIALQEGLNVLLKGKLWRSLCKGNCCCESDDWPNENSAQVNLSGYVEERMVGIRSIHFELSSRRGRGGRWETDGVSKYYSSLLTLLRFTGKGQWHTEFQKEASAPCGSYSPHG